MLYGQGYTGLEIEVTLTCLYAVYTVFIHFINFLKRHHLAHCCKNSNLSLNLGLGAIIVDHIQFHINYNIALGNTGELKADPTSAGWDYIKGSKVNTWQVSAAYIF